MIPFYKPIPAPRAIFKGQPLSAEMVDRNHYEELRWYVSLIPLSKQAKRLTFTLAALQVTYPLITHQLIDQLTTAHAYHNDPANSPPPKSEFTASAWPLPFSQWFKLQVYSPIRLYREEA